MNFLAHTVLGRAAGCGPVESLLGDFVRGRPEPDYAGAALRGIRLHRRIDSFVDRHPAHQRARSRLEAPWRRYAGVVVDVWFDHLLARDFEAVVGLPLASYSASVYRRLDTHPRPLPPALERFARRARERDLFTRYRDPGTIAEVLDAIGARLRRPVPLGESMAALRRQDGALLDDFRALWPDALAFARGDADAPPPDQTAE